jgi:hypothetical protein
MSPETLGDNQVLPVMLRKPRRKIGKYRTMALMIPKTAIRKCNVREHKQTAPHTS